jgi:hypothetical protein
LKKFIALFLLSPIVFANENNEIPLEVYMAQLDWKTGPSESLYVTYRCMGLNGLMWSMINNAPEEGAKPLKVQLRNSQQTLRDWGENLYNSLTPLSERDFVANVTKLILPMTNFYQQEIDKSNNTNDETFNLFIMSDMKLCKWWLENYRES